MSYEQCWRLVRRFATLSGVQVIGVSGQFRLPNGRDFRHGAAVRRVRHFRRRMEALQQRAAVRVCRQRFDDRNGERWVTGRNMSAFQPVAAGAA